MQANETFWRVKTFGRRAERYTPVEDGKEYRMARGTLPFDTAGSLGRPKVQFRKASPDFSSRATLAFEKKSHEPASRQTLMGMNPVLRIVGMSPAEPVEPKFSSAVVGFTEKQERSLDVEKKPEPAAVDATSLNTEKETELIEFEIDDGDFFDLALECDDASMPIVAENEEITPDLIFSAPSKGFAAAAAASQRTGVRRRLVSVDLWTIVLGTLVLSIGAQYVLRGIGLASL